MSIDLLVVELNDENVERLSLQKDGYEEAKRDRWFRSEEAGCDQGEHAIQQWVRKHWNGFVRARWIEHMEGRRFWIELPREEFGLLKRRDVIEFGYLLDEIIELVRCGAENLGIICWARHYKTDAEQVTVQHILNLININAHRIQCSFGNCPTSAS
jgi:hypothetical protein